MFFFFFSVESLSSSFQSLLLYGFTANSSHIYIYERYSGLYNWFVFWVACIFSVCLFLVVRPQTTLSLTRISTILRAELGFQYWPALSFMFSFPLFFSLFFMRPYDILISAISDEFESLGQTYPIVICFDKKKKNCYMAVLLCPLLFINVYFTFI